MSAQRNIRLLLEYDGGAYHGWQIQPGAITIQEVLEDRIWQITQRRSRVVAAGRTDAGVHALQQVAHFHTDSFLPVETLQQGINAVLPPDIRVLAVAEMPWAFHARFSAVGKRYEYRIWNDPLTSAFAYRHAWWISRPLDLEAMEEASQWLVGVRDFSSFRSANCDGRHAVREIRGCGWVRRGPNLLFWIEANAFLKYMVRSIVGTVVEVGLGKRAAEEMPGFLQAKDRSRAGRTAPARGLFLVSVFYPPPWCLDNPGWEGLSRTVVDWGRAVPGKEP